MLDWHKNHSGQNSADGAIELPTGAGKTLVGGLIGDFRRRVTGERVAYLCPTKQLARQTSRWSRQDLTRVVLPLPRWRLSPSSRAAPHPS
ncbi:DEAD/DEAH box helicase family protein [Lentzea flaviverrucosa]|uniref:DEAD/DEAH box helicase family protein n=1 Tax=Lentzea flaviverrucosa TaxID=200379 RepID=UPI0034E9548A